MGDDLHERPGETEILSDTEVAWVSGAGRVDAGNAALQVYFRDGVAEIPLRAGQPVVIGRSPRDGFTIRDGSLSREHARIELTADGADVIDLDSTNGTWVDGQRIERTVIRVGETLTLGRVLAALVPHTGDGRWIRGLDLHERFVDLLGAEFARAHAFGRPLALMMLQGDGRAGNEPTRWLPAVRALLRPFDRVAMYSADTAEILLPEDDEAAAGEFAREVLGRFPSLRCAVGAYPSHGTSADELVQVVRRCVLAADPGRPTTPQRAARTVITVGAGDDRDGPVALSEPMKAIFAAVARLASTAIPVLLLGETGTGKEVVARAIHEGGRRRDRPLVAVNCGAIPAELVESTLFGHEKGAFTGAAGQAEGVFEAAAGGTVFLDEIGEMPRPAQAALLRVLESRRVTRVGATREIEVDVRVLAATHQDLQQRCERGDFRLDLLYRLNAMTLEIPPLRQRRVEIEPLARLFVRQANEINDCDVRSIDDQALQRLLEHDWPGNVRELRNAIERAVVLAGRDTITVDDLPEPLRLRAAGARGAAADPAPGQPLPSSSPTAMPVVPDDGLRPALQRYEAELIMLALRQAGGERQQAARLLDLPVRTLNHKMKTHGIRRGEFVMR